MKANLKSQKHFLKLVAQGVLIVRKNGIVQNAITNKIYTKRNKSGYIPVAAKKNGKKIAILAHRLVWLVHKGWLEEKDQINHKDCIKHHNFLKNLEKTDNSGNVRHAYANGLIIFSDFHKLKIKFRQSGEKGSDAKLTNKQAEQIRVLYKTTNITQQKLATKFGINKSGISNIINNKSYIKRFSFKLNKR